MCKEHVPTHTPGPWRVEEYAGDLEIVGRPSTPCSRFGVEGEWTVARADDIFFGNEGEAAANARLIAAAPDLLSLLTEARARLGGIYNPEDDALYDLRDRIDAALARATPTTSLKGE